MGALLEVNGVCKAFGGIQALTECSLTVEQGKVTGLIGPNGSGKTTLFNVITGYHKVRQGQVRYDGRDITNARPDLIFKLGIARTFQLSRIFTQLSLLENVLVATQPGQGSWVRSMARTKGSSAERRRALETLDFVGLAGKWREPAGSLSYGQRRLLELAFVMITDPRVVLLDEPTAGVNVKLIEQLASQVRELNARGTTFLIVEHNMEFVMGLCDTITVLHRGAAIVSGCPEAVRDDPRVLDAYLGDGRS
jgi:ABC-type branched-subunit amino acid transport system ATPase component